MTEIMRMTAIGIIGTVLVVTLQQQKKEIALLLTVVVGTLLLWEGSSYLKEIVKGLREMAEGSGMAGDHLKLLFKLLAISYVVEFGCEVCKDAGQQSLASKIQLGGKLMMAALTIPIFRSLLTLIAELMT